MDDSEIFAQIQKMKTARGSTTNCSSPQLSVVAPQDSSPSSYSNQIIVKEMFMHTKMKIYPDGSIYLEIKGRPKDVEYRQKIKPKAPERAKATMKSIEDY
jgi:hypothetical protein